LPQDRLPRPERPERPGESLDSDQVPQAIQVDHLELYRHEELLDKIERRRLFYGGPLQGGVSIGRSQSGVSETEPGSNYSVVDPNSAPTVKPLLIWAAALTQVGCCRIRPGVARAAELDLFDRIELGS